VRVSCVISVRLSVCPRVSSWLSLDGVNFDIGDLFVRLRIFASFEIDTYG
jgi:hypothetical protein